MRNYKKGNTITVITDDISAKREIKLFCLFMEHKLVKYTVIKKKYIFLIKI